MIHQAAADGTCSGCGATLGTVHLVQPPDIYEVTSWAAPRRPQTPACTTKVGIARALDWLTRQHLYAWIRQPRLTQGLASTRVDTMEHVISANPILSSGRTAAPSKSRVGEQASWSCTCGEPVGITWRDSDGLHAMSTWQGQLPIGDHRDHWTPRDFSQTVARAREHLTKRHQLDLAQRDEEIAIAAESPSQGQTPPPAQLAIDAAATETVNFDRADDDLVQAWARDAAKRAAEAIAQRTGALRATPTATIRDMDELTAIRHLTMLIRAAEELRRSYVLDAVNGARGTGSHATWAQIGDALGVSRQAAHKQYSR